MRFSVSYRARSHFATAVGSKRTHVPTRKEGMRPAFAILKIVAREIANNMLSSSAVRAWPVCSIWSASVHWLSTVAPQVLDASPRPFSCVKPTHNRVVWPCGASRKFGLLWHVPFRIGQPLSDFQKRVKFDTFSIIVWAWRKMSCGGLLRTCPRHLTRPPVLPPDTCAVLPLPWLPRIPACPLLWSPSTPNRCLCSYWQPLP